MAQPTRIARPIGPAKPRIPNLLMRVWDVPTRLFLWAVLLLIAFSYVSVKFEWVQLHFLSGYAVLTLLLFRILWGVVGSETSRFSHFMRSPIAVLRQLWAFTGPRTPDTAIGHSAAGGWMMLFLLAILLFEVATGLFAGEKAGPLGPLSYHLDIAGGLWAAAAHRVSFNIIVGLVALNAVIIGLYAVLKRQNVVWPLIIGRKRLPATIRQPRFASPILAVAILVGSAVCVWALVRFG